MSKSIMSTRLDHYRLLGHSGLRVSPLCLGTMTFGAAADWRAEESETETMLSAYAEAGGNFIDTANTYGDGESERLVGRWLKDRRDTMVVGTKYAVARKKGDPNSGGNHRLSMIRSVEASLRSLGTDRIDLLYLHMWDFRTPADEILRAFDDLIRAGKVQYIALSDTPAWEASRMQAIAELRGWTRFAGYQAGYNLLERTAERDVIPMCRKLGIGVLPWSPLAGGVLTGKYSRRQLDKDADALTGRGQINRSSKRLTERSFAIAEVVSEISEELGHTPAQIALAWTMRDEAITAPVIGARTVDQMRENLGALEVELTADALTRLDEVSAIDLGFPHGLLGARVQERLFGDAVVEARDRRAGRDE
ncbi:aldo/keto reductase [Croceicoccus sp. YJ47]|uniref:aldo/keto reductase n=1 Tax=Croceicoccus sp. YJ47 TaxID=2798724 RepID=UPI001F4846E0|nr:aldo/keto reductase [Croceicoccus sp. YJ47]